MQPPHRRRHTTPSSPTHHPIVAGALPHRRHAHNTAAQPIKGNISQIKKNSASKKELTLFLILILSTAYFSCHFYP
jgi:hypothetical protein